MATEGSQSSSGSLSAQAQQPSPPDPNKTAYTIAVKTSDVFGAGTDANVYVQIIGTKGTSQSMQLKTSINHRNKFERKHSDVFIFPDCQHLGELKQIKIWHDNTGIGPAWHLDSVEIHDAQSNAMYLFKCGKWLSKKDDDCQTCRLLPCIRVRQKIPKHFRMQQQQMMQQQQQQQPGNQQAASEDQSDQSNQQQQQQYPYPQMQGYPPGAIPQQGQYPQQNQMQDGQSNIVPQNQNQFQAVPKMLSKEFHSKQRR